MNVHQIKTFLVAGRAVLTLKSQASGSHYTFEVSKPNGDETGERFFVSVLTDGNQFTYAGLYIPEEQKLVLTKNSRFNETDACVRAFRFLLACVTKGDLHKDLTVQHEGACGKCGRPLTHPDSLDSGMGPECGKRSGGKHKRMLLAEVVAAAA